MQRPPHAQVQAVLRVVEDDSGERVARVARLPGTRTHTRSAPARARKAVAPARSAASPARAQRRWRCGSVRRRGLRRGARGTRHVVREHEDDVRVRDAQPLHGAVHGQRVCHVAVVEPVARSAHLLGVSGVAPWRAAGAGASGVSAARGSAAPRARGGVVRAGGGAQLRERRRVRSAAAPRERARTAQFDVCSSPCDRNASACVAASAAAACGVHAEAKAHPRDVVLRRGDGHSRARQQQRRRERGSAPHGAHDGRRSALAVC